MRHLTLVLALALLPAPAFAQVPVGTTADTRPAAPQQRPGWKEGGLEAQLTGALLRGNVDMVTANAAFNGNYNLGPHKFFLDAGNTYTRAGGVDVVNRIAGSALYAYAVADDFNLYGYSTHAVDPSIKLGYRATTGLGACRHRLLAPTFSMLLLSVNPAYEMEWFQDGTAEQALRAVGRLTAAKPLSEDIELGGDAFFTPVFVDPSDLRVYAEAYLKISLTKVLKLKLTAADAYDSRPRPGVQPNDIGVFTTLLAEWGR